MASHMGKSLTEKDVEPADSPVALKISGEPTASEVSAIPVGREQLYDAIAPHESYEGFHRYDPDATWTAAEEARVIWKTDLRLLSWVCLMFFGLQLDRGNLSNALTDVCQSMS